VIYLRIDSVPVRYFYRDVRAVSGLPPMSARHGLLQSVSEVRSAIGGENANVSVSLRNASNESSALFSDPPLGAVAAVVDTVDGELFVGIVQSVALGAEVVVEIEA